MFFNKLCFLKILLLFALCMITHKSVQAQSLKIGSKKFTESVILGEIATQIAVSNNLEAEHKAELGGTRVLWNALLSGEIDIYPDYSGTILNEILADFGYRNFAQVIQHLDNVGLSMLGPLGFNNTYALGVLQKTAAKYNLESISDLIIHPKLEFGFTNEFMDRQDGWPSLRRAYNLPQKNVRGLDHDLAYKALESQKIQLMDLYSTDAEIQYYNLYVLKDDQKHFPEYHAYYLVRKGVKNRFPDYFRELSLLQNKINEDKMIHMNADVKIKKLPASLVAINFLNDVLNLDIQHESKTLFSRLFANTIDHLLLVLISLSVAILVSIPLGIYSIKRKKAGQKCTSMAFLE